MRHYGFNNFDFEILEECKRSDLNEREKYYIRELNTLYPNGYNRTPGGYAACPNKISDEDLVSVIEDLKDGKLSESDIAKKYSVHLNTISTINLGKSRIDDSILYPIRDNRKVNRYCESCGKLLSRHTNGVLCTKCTNKSKKVFAPPKDELYSLLINNTFTDVGKLYGVSTTSIRRRCKEYNTPIHADDYLRIRKNTES